MTASTAVLPYEDANSYAELRESFIETYKPANAVEASLVETVANSYWRLLRVRRVETAVLDMGIRGLKKKYNASEAPLEADDQTVAVVLNDDEDPMLKVERHQTRIERCYFQAIETLRKVQKDRLREERLTTARPARPAEIGFVSRPLALACGASSSGHHHDSAASMKIMSPQSIAQSTQAFANSETHANKSSGIPSIG